MAEFEFKPKLAHLKPKTSFRQKLSQKEPLECIRSADLKPDEDKCIGFFEHSNIIYTRSPSFRLRNLGTWFKEQASYEDARYIKSYQIKI